MFVVLFKVKTIESKSQFPILEISMSVSKKKLAKGVNPYSLSVVDYDIHHSQRV